MSGEKRIRYDKRKVEALAEAAKTNANGVARIRCPFCVAETGKPDLRGAMLVNPDGWWRCFKCDSRGRLDGFDAEVDDAAELAVVDHGLPVIGLPDGYEPLWGPLDESLRPYSGYLDDRGVGEDLTEAAQIGACTFGVHVGRVVVPVMIQGSVVGYVSRAVSPRKIPRYLNSEGLPRTSLVYNQDALHAGSMYPLLVVEGVFDALAHWPDAIALLGKPSPGQIRLLSKSPRPIVVVLDGNAWEEGRALALSLKLLGKRAASVRLPSGKEPEHYSLPDLRALSAQALASASSHVAAKN